MKATIIDIGNSKGIRIPRAFIQELSLEKEVDLQCIAHKLIITPIHNPRKDWEKSFKNSEPQALLPEYSNEFDSTEWTWD